MKFNLTAIIALSLWAAASFTIPCLGQTAQPVAPDKGMTPSPRRAVDSPAVLLDINTASAEELRALKGIGDKRADEIIKNRPYKGKDELVQKKIIPAAVYAGIKDKIVARQN